MRFGIPRNCTIGGATYTIRRSNLLEDNNMYGLTDHTKSTITLDSKLTEDLLQRTFIHEAIHQMDVVYDTHLRESQIKRLAYGVAELVKQLEVSNVRNKD